MTNVHIEKFVNAVSVLAREKLGEDAVCCVLDEDDWDGVSVVVRKPDGKCFRVSATGRELLMNSKPESLIDLVSARFRARFDDA